MARASAVRRAGAARGPVVAVPPRGRGGGAGRMAAAAASGVAVIARRPVHVEVDRAGGRGGVAEIQRARMIAALVEVAGERGVGGVTVGRIVGRSGVSRRTFYELFADREDCFLAAFDQAVGAGGAAGGPGVQGAGEVAGADPRGARGAA